MGGAGRRRVFRGLLGLGVAMSLLAPTGAVAATPRQRVIVVFNDDVAHPGAASDAIVRAHGGARGFVYRHALKGFSAELPAAALAAVARDPRVAYVEADQVVQTAEQTTPTGIRRIFADTNTNLDIDGVDDKRVDVDVAIIDTGLAVGHPDLNIVGGANCAKGGPWNTTCSADGYADGNGHGTHVGGTVGALDNGIGVVGVAPGARLHAVRVLGNSGSGYNSWIIAGIDWVTARASTIEVANMSLGCECRSQAEDDAISRAIAAGVTFVVAAGNNSKDASTFSPASHPGVITVSALADFDGVAGGLGAATCRADTDDTLADFSNFGPLVEVAAPGVCITSTWLNGGYNTISGTSMASPHVTGAAALLLSGTSTMTPAQVRSTLVSTGNFNWTDERAGGNDPKEPLLDVHSYSAATVAGPGDGLPDPEPTTPPTTPPAGGFTLSAVATKVKGIRHAKLTWSPSSDVSIRRDDLALPVAENVSGTSYDDTIGGKGGGSFTYQVCLSSNPTSCSNTATVTF
jgi:subtilisin family serine protease